MQCLHLSVPQPFESSFQFKLYLSGRADGNNLLFEFYLFPGPAFRQWVTYQDQATWKTAVCVLCVSKSSILVGRRRR